MVIDALWQDYIMSSAMVERGGEGRGWQPGDPDRRVKNVGPPHGMPERRGLRLVYSSPVPEIPTTEAGAPLLIDLSLGEPSELFGQDTAPSTPEQLAPADFIGSLSALEDIDEVRQAVATIYQAEGYVTPDEVVGGFIIPRVDPHVADSTYYGRKREGSLRATARLIRKQRLSEYPAFSEFGIDPAPYEAVDPDPTHYCEVSALAKIPEVGRQRDVLSVYASMMKDSYDSGVRYWLMSVDNDKLHTLKQLFGAKSFQQLGEEKMVMGSMTTPLVMDIHKALHLFDKRFVPKEVKQIFAEGLRGMDVSKFDDPTRYILAKQGVFELSEEEKKVKRRKDLYRNLARAGLTAYAVGRAGLIPALSLDEEGVSPYVFGVLDVATVWPYVKGIEMALTKGNSRNKKIGGAALGGASFMLPYTYAALETGLSEKFWQAMGVYMATLVGMQGIKKVWAAHKERKARQAEAAPQTQSGYPHETTW